MIRKSEISARHALWQIPVLFLLAVFIGICTNHWRADGIALVGDWSEDVRFTDASGDSMAISLGRARALFEQDAALFVDARPKSQYADGHIRGALNIPWQEADRYFMKAADRLDGAGAIVTYCDGESCGLSQELGLFLKDMGFENVRVLVNGWTVWREAGLPMEKGS